MEQLNMENFKIGFGFDIHRLGIGRKLILGGVEIPYIKGLLGYSDADCLIHAICDAILGAMGKGDIGEHFPNTDARFKDISSVKLLETVYAMMLESGFTIGNIDTMIVAEEPKVSPFKEKIRTKISNILFIKKENVNIKAGTAEGVGSIGSREAIACYAVVILIRGVKP